MITARGTGFEVFIEILVEDQLGALAALGPQALRDIFCGQSFRRTSAWPSRCPVPAHPGWLPHQRSRVSVMFLKNRPGQTCCQLLASQARGPASRHRQPPHPPQGRPRHIRWSWLRMSKHHRQARLACRSNSFLAGAKPLACWPDAPPERATPVFGLRERVSRRGSTRSGRCHGSGCDTASPPG